MLTLPTSLLYIDKATNGVPVLLKSACCELAELRSHSLGLQHAAGDCGQPAHHMSSQVARPIGGKACASVCLCACACL